MGYKSLHNLVYSSEIAAGQLGEVITRTCSVEVSLK